jgi:hypothetical protein
MWLMNSLITWKVQVNLFQPFCDSAPRRSWNLLRDGPIIGKQRVLFPVTSVFNHVNLWDRITNWPTGVAYRQPGLLCTSRNFAQIKKNVRKKISFGTKVTSESFLSISQNLKATRLKGCTQAKLWTCWRNFDLSRSFERFLGLVHGFAVPQQMI